MNEAPSPSTSERSPTSRRLVPSRSVAHWDLDITALMEFAGPASDAADRDSNWAEALLEGARIIHVNEQAVHMLRSDEPTSELPSLMRNSFAFFCCTKKKTH